MNRLIKKWFPLIVFGGALTMPSFPAYAAPLDPYIEAAKKERAVNLGLSLRLESHGKPTGSKYIGAFQKRYPFLKVNFTRVGGARERERALTEVAAGVSELDVTQVSETMVDTVLDGKLARVIDWEKLGVPKILVHPKNIGVSQRPPVYGIAYNRNLIPDDVAKTFTWETCTDPKWKGKTAMNDRPRHLNRLYQDDLWGREKTLDYAKRWAANKPAFEASQSTATEKLTSGAYYLICGLPRKQVEDIRVNTGSNAISIVFPEPVPVGIGDPIIIPSKAKHPNAAVLFQVWSSTPEGQTLIDEADFTGHPYFEGSGVNKALKGKKVFYDSWGTVANADDILAEIFQAMGMPVVR